VLHDVLTLITQTQTVDAYGDPAITESSQERYCMVKSISQSEFYQASASGLKPEIKFVLSDYYDYDGQKYLDYNDVRYTVLRTYRKGRSIELTCYTQVNS